MTIQPPGRGDNCRIQIGDEDELITGDKEYRISYDYMMGNDVLEDGDEFYFNVIGQGWQTTISNVTFTIEMPKEFEEKNLGMSWGHYRSAGFRDLNYTLEEIRSGENSQKSGFTAETGVTVRILLPEGYFERTEEIPWTAYAAILVALAGMGLAFLLWWRYGRDDPVVETVEFHAPDGLNSVDIAFIYNGNLGSKDVTSLIVYLAQKGYIEIQEGKRRMTLFL